MISKEEDVTPHFLEDQFKLLTLFTTIHNSGNLRA
jgi:hypothetical protein